MQIIGINDFKLAHQFGIINQEGTDYDVYSPILINCSEKRNTLDVECEGFQLSHQALITKNLIKNDVLIIKLMIYL